MNGRIYDPSLARFISPDPIISGGGGLQGHNRYSYCLNNPLKFVDPSGYIQKPLGWNDPLPVWNNGLGGVKGWCGPGSNKHWSDNYRSQYKNYFLMSQRDFMDRYSMNSDQYYGFMGQINPNLTSKIGTTDDKYVVTNYNSLHNNGGFYINPNGNYFCLQAIFDDNTKITAIIKLSSNEQVYLSFDFNNNNGQGGNNPIEYVGAVNDIALAMAMGYNALDNGLKRKYAYQLSKHINAKPGNIYQSAKSFGKSSAKVLGKTAGVVAVGSIAYDFGTGTANTATLVDAGMLIGGAATVAILGTVAAPFVVGAGVVYGVGCIFGFDDYLNETLDISKSINFINP